MTRKRKVDKINEEIDERSQKAVKTEQINQSLANIVDLCGDDESEAVVLQNPLPTNEVSSRNTTTPQNQLEAREVPADSLISMIVVPTSGPVRPITSLRIGVWAPDIHGNGAWAWIPLCGRIGEALHTKFMKLYVTEDRRKTDYGYFANQTARYIQRGRCVNNVTYHGRSITMTYTKANEDKQMACDFCIRIKRLCVKLVADLAGPKLCIFPLPEPYRHGMSWDSMGFWINASGWS
jgi:hypothetical protein